MKRKASKKAAKKTTSKPAARKPAKKVAVRGPAIYWASIGSNNLGEFMSLDEARAAITPLLWKKWEYGTRAHITMKRGRGYYDALTYIRDPRGWVDVTDKDPWHQMTVELRARGELVD